MVCAVLPHSGLTSPCSAVHFDLFWGLGMENGLCFEGKISYIF